MDTGILLSAIIYQFRDLFGRQNFAHFSAYLWGLMLCEGWHTVTNIYLAGRSRGSYWAMLKFLGRARWQETALSGRLLKLLLGYVPQRLYVYDHTHAVKTGKQQYGLHFFRNHRYRLKNTNQSKFHWGHQFAALGLLAFSAGMCFLFPIWVKMIMPGAKSALAAFDQVLAILPPGLIIFDRGFNNRKYFKRLLKRRHHLLCRARSNMVFYYLPTPSEQPQRGRKRIYGKRADYRTWRYQRSPIEAFADPIDLAQQIVRTKSCPEPVRLVVRRTRAKPNKPYRYFLVYTTDLTLSVETIMTFYKRRWTFETGMHHSKESFGFDHYRVRSQTAIERHIQLSFMAASLLQLLDLPAFVDHQGQVLPDLQQALAEMTIPWYHPQRWTLGLILRYLKWTRPLFSSSFAEHNIQQKWETSRSNEAVG